MSGSGGYRLRCNLLGHSKDVRAVATSGEGLVVTASRDSTARLWTPAATGNFYEAEQVYTGHTSYVTSACVLPGDAAHPEGLVATGSRDTNILVFPLRSQQAVHVLTGHSDTVSCLTWGSGVLVSGSWDHSGRIWTNWECSHELKGHEGPLWSVVVLPSEGCSSPSFLTASADKTVKLWKEGKVCTTYSGHKDCVRGLTVISATQFLSCSNDATVIRWSISGELLATHYGHSNFIYGVSMVTQDGDFVTGGEDRTLRVWGPDGECAQTIHMPAQSVWAVASLPNSDIVCGTSDGVCRIFTREEGRQADAEDIKEFEESVAKSTMAVGDLGGIKKSELPGKEVLFAPGKRDGQTVMVREGEKINCYSWSSASQQWSAVGEVVGGAGGSASTSGKILYEGKEYDYVFDVELDQGSILKLPYNVCEDPYFAAQRFIHQHELPQDFLDRVANFVIENTKGVTLGGGSGGQEVDPFTGGSRYQPGGINGAGGGTDPFTGSGRYVPASTSSGTGGADPFTGASSYTTQGAQKSPQSSHFFPLLIPLQFEACNPSGMLTKLLDFNTTMNKEKQFVPELLEKLVEAVSKPNESDPAQLGALEMALQWPVEQVWPALDVLRLALLSERMQNVWLIDDRSETLVAHLISLVRPPSPPNAQLMALRCLANLAAFQPGRSVLTKLWDQVVSATVEISPYKNKNLEIAAATVLLNYSVILGRNDNFDKKCQVLSGAGTIAMGANDPEAQFRSLVALGTLLHNCGQCRSLAGSLDMKPVVQTLSTVTSPAKVGECAGHVLGFL
ncbi:Phospholipase A-2-activating protein [Chionoecetes opilio]|uniref:Phospholipase A-2-activating protein n=1 Tax=Chionoecetes opilio TaxID=41210 RepID=A0A8J4Y0C2_CHIOP|nr:Phospholipase A-2-activating protein [Chionoecetes opilio]